MMASGTTASNYGGLPIEEAEESVRLFARDALPEVQRW